MNETNQKTDRFIHKFEEAGLGIAPFYVVDVVRGENWYACDFCSTAIKERCYIAGAGGGKIFVVGNECVRHTGDAGLIDTVKRAVNDARRLDRRAREEKIITAGREVLEKNEEIKRLFALKPHPNASFADDGKTLLDYVDFMFASAGNKGKLETVELVFKYQDARVTAADERDYETWQRQIRAAREEKAAGAKVENADIVEILKSRNKSDFIESMIEKLETVPLRELTDRQYGAVANIYARHFGSERSRKYNDALSALAKRRNS